MFWETVFSKQPVHKRRTENGTSCVGFAMPLFKNFDVNDFDNTK